MTDRSRAGLGSAIRGADAALTGFAASGKKERQKKNGSGEQMSPLRGKPGYDVVMAKRLNAAHKYAPAMLSP